MDDPSDKPASEDHTALPKFRTNFPIQNELTGKIKWAPENCPEHPDQSPEMVRRRHWFLTKLAESQGLQQILEDILEHSEDWRAVIDHYSVRGVKIMLDAKERWTRDEALRWGRFRLGAEQDIKNEKRLLLQVIQRKEKTKPEDKEKLLDIRTTEQCIVIYTQNSGEKGKMCEKLEALLAKDVENDRDIKRLLEEKALDKGKLENLLKNVDLYVEKIIWVIVEHHAQMAICDARTDEILAGINAKYSVD